MSFEQGKNLRRNRDTYEYAATSPVCGLLSVQAGKEHMCISSVSNLDRPDSLRQTAIGEHWESAQSKFVW